MVIQDSTRGSDLENHSPEGAQSEFEIWQLRWENFGMWVTAHSKLQKNILLNMKPCSKSTDLTMLGPWWSQIVRRLCHFSGLFLINCIQIWKQGLMKISVLLYLSTTGWVLTCYKGALCAKNVCTVSQKVCKKGDIQIDPNERRWGSFGKMCITRQCLLPWRRTE